MQKEQLDKIKDQFTFDWKISHIDEYFKAAVLVPLVEIDGELHILFEKRAQTIKQGGEICFPGGKIDPEDASSLHAALRETQEEIGCRQEQIDILGRLDTLFLPSGVLINPYIGILNEKVEQLKIEPAEVAAVFTVPVGFFLKNEPEHYDCKVMVHPYTIDPETKEKEDLLPVEELGLPEYYREPWGNARHRIYAYRTEHGVIWGLTAQILYDCIQELKEMMNIT